MDISYKEEIAECKMRKPKQPWYKHVTTEPAMFFYMMAFMITNVIEQTFYVFRACTVNHGYSEDICYNISGYPEINKEVQVTVAWFLQWFGISSHLVPCGLAFFLGSYSDKRGRKGIILAGLLGKLYFSAITTLNTMKGGAANALGQMKRLLPSLQLNRPGRIRSLVGFELGWPVEYVIYTAVIPSALTGADLAIFAGCFAYVADVSTVESRTFRIGILDVVYLSTMPTGVAIGNLLYNKVVNRSFTAMFAINTCLMIIATLYTVFCLDWQTRPEHKSLREAKVTNPIKDFFELNNIKQTLTTLTKKRSKHRRLFLWFLLISMAFYTFQRDERSVMYLYTITMFKWGATSFSHFRTYSSTAYVIVMLFGIPLMTKVFQWRDTLILMLGAISHITGHFIYAQANDGQLMYVGATVAALGPCIPPLIRSMTSKVLAPSEKDAVGDTSRCYLSAVLGLSQILVWAPALADCVEIPRNIDRDAFRGVAYAFLSVMENAVGIFSAVVYSQLYNATLSTDYINAIFFLTMGTQVVVFFCACSMEVLLRGRRLETIIEYEEEQITST